MSSTNRDNLLTSKTETNEISELEKAFRKARVELWKIVPVHILSQIKTKSSNNLWCQDIPFLPLEWFDERPFDEFIANFEQLKNQLNEEEDDEVVKGVAFLTKWNLDVIEQYMNRSNISISSFETTNLSITTDYSSTTASIASAHKSNIFTWTNVAVLSVDLDQQLVEVEDDITEESYWVPAVYVKLSNEPSHNFVANVKQVLEKRDEAEKQLKYQLMLESIPFKRFEEKKFPTKIINKINKKLGKNLALSEELLLDVIRHYQVKHVEMDLWKNVDSYKKTLPYIVLPIRPPKNKIWTSCKEKIEYDFPEQRTHFNWLQIYTFPQIYNLVQFIRKYCAELSQTPLFFITDLHPIELSFFDEKESQHIEEVSNYLYDSPDQLVKVIRRTLAVLEKSWFDIKVDKWEIYLISKLYRLIQLIRYHIQNAIR